MEILNLFNSHTFVLVGNRGCGVWVMLSSLPQLIGNYITHNRMYGLAVFCRKDPAFSASSERGGGGERERGGQENFHEEGELLAWESDMDSEDERFSTRRPITVALVENNCISQNGGEKHCKCRVDSLILNLIYTWSSSSSSSRSRHDL